MKKKIKKEVQAKDRTQFGVSDILLKSTDKLLLNNSRLESLFIENQSDGLAQFMNYDKHKLANESFFPHLNITKNLLAKPDYSSIINNISIQNGVISTINKQFDIIGHSSYPNLISNAVTRIKDKLYEFNPIKSHLPALSQLITQDTITSLTREATLSISSLSSKSNISNLVANINNNYQPWYKAYIEPISHIVAQPQIGFNVLNYQKNLENKLGINTISEYSIHSSISKAAELSIFAEKSVCGITNENFASRLIIAEQQKSLLVNSMIDLTHSYSSLMDSYRTNPLSYVQLNPLISRIVPYEYFGAANVIEAISIEEEVTPEEEIIKNEIHYENEILLSSHLPMINNGLFIMWKGAIEAFNSSNSDKIRHFITSIRELYTHLFKILAPDKEIKEWTSDEAMFHEGRPTRKTRLLYICRNINNESFSTFIKKDVDATIEFINIFQKGTHEIESNFTQNQLITIKSKAESTLKFILEIHFHTNR